MKNDCLKEIEIEIDCDDIIQKITTTHLHFVYPYLDGKHLSYLTERGYKKICKFGRDARHKLLSVTFEDAQRTP